MAAPSIQHGGRNRGVVRDATGELATLLSTHIDDARRLLADELGIDEGPALLEWTMRSREWRAATTHTLASRFDGLVVEEFDTALEPAELAPRTARTIDAERHAVKRAIELLVALRGTQTA
jgi:hypothetical protein